MLLTCNSKAVFGFSCNPESIDLSCNGRPQKIHFTFDDGPEPYALQYEVDKSGNPNFDKPIMTTSSKKPRIRNNTKAIADILQQNKVPATFFVMGYKFEKEGLKKTMNKPTTFHAAEAPSISDWPTDTGQTISDNYETLDYLLQKGFGVGSHTHYHINHGSVTDSERGVTNVQHVWEIEPLNQLFSQPPMVRLPYGICWNTQSSKTQCQSVMAEITGGQNPATHIGWNIDSQDWRTVSQQQDEGKIHPLLANISTGICSQNGGIVLFHEKHNATVDNLQCIIDELKKAGHIFVDINDPVFKDMTNIKNSKNAKPLLQGNIMQLTSENTRENLNQRCPKNGKTLYDQIKEITRTIQKVGE